MQEQERAGGGINREAIYKVTLTSILSLGEGEEGNCELKGIDKFDLFFKKCYKPSPL